MDARTKFGKALGGKNIVLFESKKLYDNQIADWISTYCKSKNEVLNRQRRHSWPNTSVPTCRRITNELDKLAINLPPGALMTEAAVQENIGISKEYNVFELQKAIAQRDIAKVSRIREHFASNMRKNPLIVTISSLFAYFSKVYMLHGLKGQPDGEVLKALELRSDWFLKEYKIAAANYNFAQTVQAISLLKTYDLRSKGVDNDNTSNGEDQLMKELFWKLMH